MRTTCFVLAAWLAAVPAALPAAETLTIPVDSPAVVYSPGNWTGDAGRGGSRFRQTWNPGAYARVTWSTRNPQPQAKIILDTSTYPAKLRPPQLTYCIDGVWKSRVPCAAEVPVAEIAGAGNHELVVYLTQSQQMERWGSPGQSGRNVLRIAGFQVDAQSQAVPAAPAARWALIVGDSITEGIGATELAGWSHLVGQALQTQGFEYGISACGWSGWINKGDNPPGDVPGYYVVRDSRDGAGGQYDDAASRWNKIDGNGHSLLDQQGRLSAYGRVGQEPALILINYGTNDALHHSNPSDTAASIAQGLVALHRSAPDAQLVVLIPFGQYYARPLKEAVEAHNQAHPDATPIAVIDLGPAVAKTLAAKDGLMGGLHPNDRGHANFAAKIIPQVLALLPPTR